ncbi:MAG: hypothetical protein WEB67_12525 [Acidimicrobiia bacterium]
MKSAYLWYGRFIGVANLIYGAWLIIATVINTTNGSYGAGWLALFYLFGLTGMVGSTFFLLSLDGSQRFRTVSLRRVGWIAMFAATLLPTSVTFFLSPLTALSVGLALRPPAEPPSAD